ncbi:P-loop containing nucleoside triphosphate hydrolase protein, partial [Dimargaris cristalligena]
MVSNDETPAAVSAAPASFNAREYQIALFKAALQCNTIVVLDTGAGKTFIATMLIQHFAATGAAVPMPPPTAGLPLPERRLSVFLVNLVPLVVQQSRAIQTQSGLRVNAFCGDMGADNWNASHWDHYCQRSDVFVMTAQVFLDALRHAFLRLDQFHLLVFDECHHARKAHPYNRIMVEFYKREPPATRPRIFGLTASPLCLKASIE